MKPRLSPIAALAGKRFVVTGASRGLGLEIARSLLQRGASVVLACRSARRMQQVAAELEAVRCPGAELIRLELDLARLESVRAAGGALCERGQPLDGLINNAGILAVAEHVTADGFELNLASNYLGHFALTGLVLPLLEAAPCGRVVSVSSLLHRGLELAPSDVPRSQPFDARQAYGRSKLANLLFAYELERRLRRHGSRIQSLACHPGYAETGPLRPDPATPRSYFVAAVSRVTKRALGQSALRGALPALVAACSTEVAGGDYVGPGGPFGLRGAPVRARSSARSYDAVLARQLWERAEQLTGVRYPFAELEARAR